MTTEKAKDEKVWSMSNGFAGSRSACLGKGSAGDEGVAGVIPGTAADRLVTGGLALRPRPARRPPRFNIVSATIQH